MGMFASFDINSPCIKLANHYYNSANNDKGKTVVVVLSIWPFQNQEKRGFMRNYKKWTEAETTFIMDNHHLFNDETLAMKLTGMTGQEITTAMVRRQRRKLSLKKNRGRPRKVVPAILNDTEGA